LIKSRKFINIHRGGRCALNCEIGAIGCGSKQNPSDYQTRRNLIPEATIVLVLTLVAHGCLIAAIEAAFGLQKRTVHGWIEAAGLTSHRWSMSEVLEYHVPPVCWQSQKRRGRRSKAMQHLLDRWAA
jgi:hypothetical protein